VGLQCGHARKVQEEAEKEEYPGWADEVDGYAETKREATETPTASAMPSPEAYLPMRIKEDTG
jgi:hypothetical protein